MGRDGYIAGASEEGRSQTNGFSARAAHRCRMAITAILCGLFVQFLLGIYLNLYVPDLHGQPALVGHIVLGTGLVVGGVVAVVTAVQSRRTDHLLTAAIGLIALGLAWVGGLRFLRSGSKSTDSLLMAIGFACAVAALSSGLVTISRGSHEKMAP